MQLNYFSFPMFVGIGFLSFLMHLVARRNRGRVVTAFMIVSSLVILYSLLFSAYLVTVNPNFQKIFFHLMVFVTVFIPMTVLFFLLEYLGYDNWMNWKDISLLLAIPTVSGFLELTNPWHGLFWEKIEIIERGGFTYIHETPGFIPVLLTTYLYFIMGISMALLAWGISQTPKHRRRELSIMIIALGVPLIVDMIRSFNLNPWPYVYITPYGVLVSVSALGYSIIRYDFLNVIPAAYSRLFSEVTDTILVFDHKYNLIDVNQTAQHLFFQQIDVQPSSSIKDLPHELEQAIRNNANEIKLLLDGQNYYFDLRYSEIIEKAGRVRSVIVMLHDISWRKQTELELQNLIQEKETLLTEKEVLLREINHRVKNNFNLAGSLLFLEAQKFKEKSVKDAFEVSRDRLRTMSLLNERLYRSEKFNNLNLGSYLCSIAEDLMSVQAPHDLTVDLQCKTEPVFVGPQEAIPCGLIVNELVTNSLKYAFGHHCEQAPTITISLFQGRDGSINLQVIDNGCGYPEAFNYEESDSLGMKLVHMLGQDQLGGAVNVGNEQGAFFRLSFFAEPEEG